MVFAGEIIIALAGPPLAKARARVTRSGSHVYTPDKTVRYEGRLANVAQEVMAGRDLLDGPLAVELVVRLPIPVSKPKKWQAQARAGTRRPTRKPDWDNFAKMLDALNLIVWLDDSQVVDGKVSKVYSDRPGLEIIIRPITEELEHGPKIRQRAQPHSRGWEGILA